MSYQRVQFLGYEVSVDYTNNGPTMGYAGEDTDDADITLRQAAMTSAVETAYALADPSDNVLKVFMAPEFSWRPASGGYEPGSIDRIADSMRASVLDPKWDHWVFVWGTVIEAQPSTGVRSDIFNCAIVTDGGPTDHAQQAIVKVYKSHMSHIDFAFEGDAGMPGRTGRASVGRREGILHGAPRSLAHGMAPANACPGIFEMNGVTFGLEICLDHARGRLRTLVDALSDGERLPQLLLIPSAGMSLIADSVHQDLPEAIVFNVDGLNPQARDMVYERKAGATDRTRIDAAMVAETDLLDPKKRAEWVHWFGSKSRSGAGKGENKSANRKSATSVFLDRFYRSKVIQVLDKHFHKTDLGKRTAVVALLAGAPGAPGFQTKPVDRPLRADAQRLFALLLDHKIISIGDTNESYKNRALLAVGALFDRASTPDLLARLLTRFIVFTLVNQNSWTNKHTETFKAFRRLLNSNNEFGELVNRRWRDWKTEKSGRQNAHRKIELDDLRDIVDDAARTHLGLVLPEKLRIAYFDDVLFAGVPGNPRTLKNKFERKEAIGELVEHIEKLRAEQLAPLGPRQAFADLGEIAVYASIPLPAAHKKKELPPLPVPGARTMRDSLTRAHLGIAPFKPRAR